MTMIDPFAECSRVDIWTLRGFLSISPRRGGDVDPSRLFDPGVSVCGRLVIVLFGLMISHVHL